MTNSFPNRIFCLFFHHSVSAVLSIHAVTSIVICFWLILQLFIFSFPAVGFISFLAGDHQRGQCAKVISDVGLQPL